MIDPTSLNAVLTLSRHLSLCPDRNPPAKEKCTVLLVEPAMILLSDRERLLQAAGYCVTAVLGVQEVLLLRPERPVTFAVLNDLLGTSGLRTAAIAVRRQWPLAKILVIGCAVPALEDHLYDEVISHRHEVDGLLDVLKLLSKGSWNQRLAGVYRGYRKVLTAASESDSTKYAGQTNRLDDGSVQPQRMRANA